MSVFSKSNKLLTTYFTLVYREKKMKTKELLCDYVLFKNLD